MPNYPIDSIERRCINCQLLGFVHDHHGEAFRRHSLLPADRVPIGDGQTHESMNTALLRCCAGVWRVKEQEAPALNAIAVRKEIEQDRGGTCFFFPVSEGMSIDAAEELERRQAAGSEAEKDRALTRNSLWWAAFAVWVSVISVCASLAWDVWKHFYLLKEQSRTMTFQPDRAPTSSEGISWSW